MKKLSFSGLLVIMLMPMAYAETAYVTDILRLGLHAAQDTSDRPFQTLVSGSELDILQRQPNYAEVVTKDGTQGWVKSAYLVSDKPAALIVAETESELERMRGELAAARTAQAAAESELQHLLTDADSAVGRMVSLESSVAELTVENEELESRLETYRGAVPAKWAAAAFGVALLGGFFLGLWVLDAYVRHRHAGFRVY